MTTFLLILFYGLHVVALAGLAAMLVRPAAREWFERRCIGPATAIDLAWIRIVTCGVLILYVLSEDLPSYAGFTTDWYTPPGYSAWFGRGVFDWFLSSATRLHALSWVLIATLGLAMAGVATRVTVPVAAILYFLFAALLRSFGKYFHEGYLGFYVLAVLCFLPCADAWSVDARRRRQPPAPAAYAWGVWACWAAIVIPYVQLGISKLLYGGLFWFDGRSLRNYMLVDNLNLEEWNLDIALRFIETPTFVFTIAGFFALLVELTYVSVLVVPWLRRILPVCVAFLHLGIWFGQDALFLDAILIPLIFFMPGRRMARAR